MVDKQAVYMMITAAFGLAAGLVMFLLALVASPLWLPVAAWQVWQNRKEHEGRK